MTINATDVEPDVAHATDVADTADDADFDLTDEVETPPADAPALSLDDVLEQTRAAYERPRYSIRELAIEAIELDVLLQSTGGELTPEMEVRYDALLRDLTRKSDAMGDFHQALKLDIGGLKVEKDRLQEKEKRRTARLVKWTERIKRYLITSGHLRLEGEYWITAVEHNPPKLEILDRAAIPEQYKSMQTPAPVEVLDEAALKRDLLANEKEWAAYNKAVQKWEQAMKKWDAGPREEGTAPAQPVGPPADPPSGAVLTRGTTLRFK